MWIDITRTLTNGMIHWPGDPPFRWERFEDLGGPGSANVSRIETSVHVGTHIDAPLHYIQNGNDVAEVPLSKLCGLAVVVHVMAARDITVEDLQAAEIRAGERVLLRTANESLWEKQEFDPDFFGISGDAAMWLVDQGAPLVGVDYLSVDGYHDEAKVAHHALLGNDVIVVESLDLSAVEEGRYEMVALPLKIAGSEGSPARVIIRPIRG
jgi:arylformamidase